MAVVAVFGLAPAIADTATQMSCQTDSGCSMDNCSAAQYIYDAGTDTCPCSCTGSCLNDTTKTQNNDSSYTCETAHSEFGDLCNNSMCSCCYRPGGNGLACNPTNHVIKVGCEAVETGYCWYGTGKTKQQKSISEYCAKDIMMDISYYCDKGYYGLTSNSASGTCTQCPEMDGVWTDSARTTLVRKTTTEYLGVGSTAADCCLPELQSGQYYYDATGKFNNNLSSLMQ